MNADLGILEIAEVAAASVLSDNSIRKPHILVLAAQPKSIDASEILFFP